MNRICSVIVLIVASTVLVGGMETAYAAPVTQLDSSSFSWKYEMDVKPNTQDIAAGVGADWGVYSAPNSGTINGDGTMTTTGGANFEYLTSGGNAAQVGSALSFAAGWTFETRVEVHTTGNIGTGNPAGIGWYGQPTGAGATGAILYVNDTQVWWGISPSRTMLAGNLDNSSTAHTYRVSQDPNIDTYYVWRDGILIGDTLSTASGASAWGGTYSWGSISGQMAGLNVVDYYRITSGAYSPVSTSITSVTWTGTTGPWSTGSNWSSSAAPTATNIALINNGGTAQITSGAATAYGVSLGADDGSGGSGISGNLSMSGGTLTLGDGGAIVGGQGTGVLTQSAGSITSLGTATVTLGGTPTGVGTYNLSGTGALTVNGANLIVGEQGSGTFNMTGGSISVASLNVGRLANTDGFTFGAGVVNQSAGSVTLRTSVSIGPSDLDASTGTGSGAYNLSGTGTLALGTFASAENAGMFLGVAGDGTFTQSGSSTVTLNGNFYSGSQSYNGLYIGGRPYDAEGVTRDGVGTYNMNGGTLQINGTTRTAVDASMDIGRNGVGHFNMTGGTVTTANDIFVARRTGSAGSTLSMSDGSISAAHVIVGANDNATMTMSGGTVTAGSNVQVGWDVGSTASAVNMSGGAMNASQLIVGSSGVGTMSISGAAAVDTNSTVIGYTATGVGVLNLNGGTLTTDSVGRQVVGASGKLYFNGGTLKSKTGANASTWVSNLTNAYVSSGGAVIDTNGFNVTIPQALEQNTGSTGGGLTKKGAGTLTLTAANTYTGRSVVQEGILQLNGSSAQSPVLTGGGADVQSGQLIFDYTGQANPASTIVGLLAASYNGGAWNVGQIRNTTAITTGLTLGWKDDTALSQVTVIPTYSGDANLSGKVDVADLTLLLNNYNKTGQNWATGDFDYDGSVNVADLTALLNRYNMSVGGSLAAESYPTYVGLGDSVVFTVVPEPGTLALLATGLMGLVVYAWRKRR